jgi:hypothetical protein
MTDTNCDVTDAADVMEVFTEFTERVVGGEGFAAWYAFFAAHPAIASLDEEDRNEAAEVGRNLMTRSLLDGAKDIDDLAFALNEIRSDLADGEIIYGRLRDVGLDWNDFLPADAEMENEDAIVSWSETKILRWTDDGFVVSDR